MATPQGYRADIDGLRAIAVLSVIISHMMPGLLPGGFLGVDVFFVISGYLISSIIARQVMQGSFSFGDFYARRIKRLAPAFVVMLIVVYAVGWFIQLPDEFHRTGLAGAFGVLSISNLYFGKTADYFAPDTSLDPLVHIWSLSIEEQFYLLFPAVLVIILGGLGKWKGSAIATYGTLAALIVTSLGYAWIVETHEHGSGYFSLLARMWELGIGALLGVLTARGWKGLPRGILTNAATIVALLGLLLSFIFITEASPHPGPITLIPVLATVVLLVGGAWTMTSAMLSIKPMVWIGAISYSAYLWHQPAIAFYVARTGAHPDLDAVALLMIAVLCIAFVSWRFVETPMRHLQALNRRVFLSFVLVALIVFSLSALIASRNGYPERLPPEVVKLANYTNIEFSSSLECHLRKGLGSKTVEESLCVHGLDPAPEVLLWGDSHTASLSSGFMRADPGFSFVQASVSGCFPILSIDQPSNKAQCAATTKGIFEYLRRHKEIEVVVMLSRWHKAADRVYVDPRDGKRAKASDIKSGILDLVQSVSEMGKEVIVVDPIPEYWTSVPSSAARWELLYGAGRDRVNIKKEKHDKINRDAYELLSELSKIKGVIRVGVEDLFCSEGTCELEGEEGVYLYDDDHASSEGASLVASRIISILKDSPYSR